MTTQRFAAIAALAAFLPFAGCASASGPGAGGAGADMVPQLAAPNAAAPVGKYIKHVVIIVQENRTFENIFAGWPGADAPMYGYSDASGKDVKVNLKPIPFQNKDLDHLWQNAIDGWNGGKMDGFENNFIGTNNQPAGTYPYSYLEHSAIGPYRALASQYTLADHMFPTMFGPSFTAHLDLIAGTTNLADDLAVVNLPNGSPWGCDAAAGTATSLLTKQRVVEHGVGPFPCFSGFATMADTLDAAHVSWKYYAPNILLGPSWSAFDAIKKVRYGPDWANVISPQTMALTDPGKGALPSMTWVTPDYLDSDHPETNSDTGPSWVAGVVNAIGKSPDWNSTAIIVVWDDWGGWYDNAAPPQKDFRGLGIRVPCIIISPYARKGYVDHSQYEFASMLHFAEQAFGLPFLGTQTAGYTDARAKSMTDAFDFTQPPRAFVPIKVKYPPSYFINRPQSMVVPDAD
jgi:phospholipase C